MRLLRRHLGVTGKFNGGFDDETGVATVVGREVMVGWLYEQLNR